MTSFPRRGPKARCVTHLARSASKVLFLQCLIYYQNIYVKGYHHIGYNHTKWALQIDFNRESLHSNKINTDIYTP